MWRILIIGPGDVALRLVPQLTNKFRVYALVRRRENAETLRLLGVTPIVLFDNSAFPGELTGTAYLDGTVGNVPMSYAGINLVLNLDAYAGTSPLTLIDAPHESTVMMVTTQHLVGVFGTVTFLGSRTATVNYDYVNGDVFLNNFQNGAGAGSLATAAVPEPSGLAMIVTLGLLLCSHSVRERNGSRPGGRHRSRGKSMVFARMNTLNTEE